MVKRLREPKLKRVLSKYEAAMPQFDLSSFIVQLFWLFVALIGFYLTLSLYFLPITSQYIKARKPIRYLFLNCAYPLLEQPKLKSYIFITQKLVSF